MYTILLVAALSIEGPPCDPHSREMLQRALDTALDNYVAQLFTNLMTDRHPNALDRAFAGAQRAIEQQRKTLANIAKRCGE